MTGSIATQATPLVPIARETHYDLQSNEAYVLYLPQRANELVRVATQQGIDAACAYIEHDNDLDSFLFIIRADDPYRMIAYSRQKQFFNKTVSELQQLIFPQCASSECSLELIFNRLVSTAQKGDTYAPYLWRISPKDPIRYQVAYVHLFQENEASYVLGATMFFDFLSNNLILAHRTKTVIERIKKEGFESVAPLLAHDLDPVLYFYVRQYEFPYRYLVHGANQKLVSLSPDEAQRVVFSNCDSLECSMKFVVERSGYAARHGGGAYVYLWRARPELPIDLKLAYVQPFVYKGHKVFVGTGYTPRAIPGYIKDDLPRRTQEIVRQVQEVGLDNAISDIKKKNSDRLYAFIVEQEPPYFILVHKSPELSGHTPEQAQAMVRDKNKTSFDFVNIFSQMANYVQDLGKGFYAYDYLSAQSKERSPRLKITFLEPLVVDGRRYFVGASYEHESVDIKV